MIARRTFLRIGAGRGRRSRWAAGRPLAGCAPDADVLRVGTKIDVPGFGFQNPETGNIEGLEVDIARELAKRIKGSPDALQVTGVNVTTRGAMLDNGTLDATLATFTITEERKKKLQLLAPVLHRPHRRAGEEVLRHRRPGGPRRQDRGRGAFGHDARQADGGRRRDRHPHEVRRVLDVSRDQDRARGRARGRVLGGPLHPERLRGRLHHAAGHAVRAAGVRRGHEEVEHELASDRRRLAAMQDDGTLGALRSAGACRTTRRGARTARMGGS